MIPHVTNETSNRIYAGGEGVDTFITEGTTGDIEGLPFLEAMRQFALKSVPATSASSMSRSSRTQWPPASWFQQSVAKLREIGIQPHVLVCRCDTRSTLICGEAQPFLQRSTKAVNEEQNVETSIYAEPCPEGEGRRPRVDIPQLNAPPVKNNVWQQGRPLHQEPQARGESWRSWHIELQDAYKSIYESLYHAGIANNCAVEIVRIDAGARAEGRGEGSPAWMPSSCLRLRRPRHRRSPPPRYARENKVPYYGGICLGLQIAVIEFSATSSALKEANKIVQPRHAGPGDRLHGRPAPHHREGCQ